MPTKPTAVDLTALAAAIAVAFAGQPAGSLEVQSPVRERLFEIRTYTCEPGRLPALLARFRNHTTRLFEKHGMTNIGYWVPTDGERAKDTLIYVLAHKNRAAADKSWDAFRSDPDWIQARDASEADGKIVAKLESVYVAPTDFSPLK